MPEVKVSVIIACRNAAATIGRCLESLRRQQTREPFEIIAADSSTDGTHLLIQRGFPEVRLLRFNERKWPGDARNAAIQASRGEILAFLDADCEAAPGWIDAAVEALRGWDGSAGGEIGQAEPASLSAWAAYFCEFSHWMPGTPAGAVFEVPTCNMAVRRSTYDETGPFLEGVYCSDSEFHWRLRRSGRAAKFFPPMRVAHMTAGGWAMLARHEYFHGRSFGLMRVRRGALSGSRLAFLRIAGSALPLWLPVKTAARVVSRGRYLKQLALCLPLLALASAAWGLGELAGYWMGEPE